jgi:hypothetical protein
LPPAPDILTLSLELQDLKCAEAICTILDFLRYTYAVRITRCVVEDVPLFAYEVSKGRLILEGIDINQDLEYILGGWMGGELHVRSCPGFNDAVLGMMATISAKEFRSATCVHTLKISDCPNFSVPKLKRLIKVRRDNVVPPDEDICSGTIFELALSGDVPRFTSEERRWFIRNLQKFSYHETT